MEYVYVYPGTTDILDYNDFYGDSEIAEALGCIRLSWDEYNGLCDGTKYWFDDYTVCDKDSNPYEESQKRYEIEKQREKIQNEIDWCKKELDRLEHLKERYHPSEKRMKDEIKRLQQELDKLKY